MNNTQVKILKIFSKPARAVTLRTGNYRSFLISAPVLKSRKNENDLITISETQYEGRIPYRVSKSRKRFGELRAALIIGFYRRRRCEDLDLCMTESQRPKNVSSLSTSMTLEAMLEYSGSCKQTPNLR